MNTISLSQKEIRRIIIDQSYQAHVGHIGSSLSIVEIMLAISSCCPEIFNLSNPDRDRLVFSKGHAALVLYALLFCRGLISEKELNTYCRGETLFGVHTDSEIPGIDFSAGSLGMGLPFAVGLSLFARLNGSSERILTVMSDAECNEGSVWEAAMFAGHHVLSNLHVVIDYNNQQALGCSDNILDQSNLEVRFRSFGWKTLSVEGHNIRELEEAVKCRDKKPTAIIAHTLFGKGVSFMEKRLKWHYWPLSDSEYRQALMEIEA